MKRLAVTAIVLMSFVACGVRADDKPRRGAQTRTKLLQPITMPAIEAGTPLRETLQFLSEKFDLSIVLDVDAFRENGLADVGDETIPLPKMQGVRLHTVLLLALARLQGDYYVQPDGVIYVLPRDRAVPHQLRQPVRMELEKTPLVVAVQELQEQSGFNIVLDSRRAGDKARMPITVQLNNVTVEAAVSILADMAELTPVLIDNVYYITTAENAARLQKEQDRKREALP